MQHDIGIVILNWNTKELLKRTIETVLASIGAFTYQLVVVDNASSDGSADMVAETFPQVMLIRSEINGGYPYGNNLGFRWLGFHDDGTTEPTAPRYVPVNLPLPKCLKPLDPQCLRRLNVIANVTYTESSC